MNAALFVITKQARCPSTGQFIETNLVYPYSTLQFNNEKELAINPCNIINASQVHLQNRELYIFLHLPCRTNLSQLIFLNLYEFPF